MLLVMLAAMVTGDNSCVAQKAVSSAFFTFYTQVPQVHSGAAGEIPAFQYVFFEAKTPSEVFNTLPYQFYVYSSHSQSENGNGRVVKIPFKGVEPKQLKEGSITKTILPGNETVYSFSVKASSNVVFEYYDASFAGLYEIKPAKGAQPEFAFFDADSLRLAQKQEALVALVTAYNAANSYKHTDTATQNKLLYILNRTIGTQENLRSDFAHISWQEWGLQTGLLICNVVGIQNNVAHKCTYKSKQYLLPLKNIARFEQTADGLVRVVFGDSQTGALGHYSAVKSECSNLDYQHYEETLLLKKFELNALWSIGHAGLSLAELNAWLQDFKTSE
ncbi:MAG: hypothetical protein KIS94_06900 [Chitinophagales bacterium]|nr:hypothetical protein [Chitinophagales bacterium]